MPRCWAPIQPQPIDGEADGSLDLDKVAAAIKADDFHFARTRLLALENTMQGKVLPLDYLAAARLHRARGLALHLDGARLYNAAVKLGVDASEITGTSTRCRCACPRASVRRWARCFAAASN